MVLLGAPRRPCRGTLTCPDGASGQIELVQSIEVRRIGAGFRPFEQLGLPQGGGTTTVYLPLVLTCE